MTPMRSLASILMATLTLAGAALAQSQGDDDSNKPVNIEADRGSYDDLKQLAIFTGNVVMTRGSLVVHADRVEVRQTPEGFDYGTAFGSADKLASFRQKRPGLDQYVEGWGERIDYDGRNDIVTLNQRALMRRLESGVTYDELSGHTITYNNRTDVYNVVSGASASTPANPQGRVRATIQPRPRDEKRAPQSGVPLQSTGALGDAAKRP